MNRAKHVGCSVGGCCGEHRSLGLCAKHYARQHRHGSPHAGAGGIPDRVGTPRDQSDVAAVLRAGGTLTRRQWLQVREGVLMIRVVALDTTLDDLLDPNSPIGQED